MPIYEFEGKKPVISSKSFVHPDAVIIGDVTIGDRCFIAPGVVIRADCGSVTIHNDTSIQDNTVIHVDPGATVVIENEVLVGHGAIIHDSHIKDRCVIGMGAILLFGVVCEEGAFIGAGTVVPSGMVVPRNKIATGNPAKIIKDVTPLQQEYAASGAREYVKLTEQYQKNLTLIS